LVPSISRIKFRIEKEKTEELKSKPMHGQFYRDFERSSVDKENSCVVVYLRPKRRNEEFDNSFPNASTQHACSSEDRGQQDVESEQKDCASYN
jgi:hypothetical protein